ncbi:MAG TPA: hypothetical protein PKD53_21365 [Chloroflexaceae bacterium]|nr:hypothetical protein [Chloroflexaceae bacterium]
MTHDQPAAGPQLSLLWPPGRSPDPAWRLPREVAQDLGLAAIVAAMEPAPGHGEALEAVLFTLCPDPAVIAYRQDVLDDLLAAPALAATLGALLPALDELALFTARPASAESSLQEVTRRAGELELLVGCVEGLAAAFAAAPRDLSSASLAGLRAYVEARRADPAFTRLAAELPALLAELRASASVTIGVNLDPYLRPEEAMLLAVHPTRFTESGLLARLFGATAAHGRGIGPLHTLPLLTESSGMITGGGAPLAGPTRRAEPMLEPLFRDLSRVLEKVTRPVAQELRQHAAHSGRALVELRPGAIWFTYAVALLRRVAATGLPLCRPTIAPLEERVCEVEALYNLQLALHLAGQQPGDLADRVVASDSILGPRGRIVILTGPNQGGKTTYLQAIGQAHVLAQAGLRVPGRQARLSPADAIFTHFPVEERLERGTGRFGDEARRMRAIFEGVTRHSLVLLNETFATTSAGESLYIARDVVRLLRRLGARAVYTTHLHELAGDLDRLNADTPGDSDAVSMVALAAPADSDGRSAPSPRFQIVLRPPAGRSYAEQIATRYGIAFDQLAELLEARGVVPGGQALQG